MFNDVSHKMSVGISCHQVKSTVNGIPAFRYGCSHEKIARADYIALMSSQHENFTVADSGLHLNSKWPYMAASPDGVVECSCCDLGASEIK